MSAPSSHGPSPLIPEVARGHGVGSSGDRRVVAVGLLIVGAPFVFGAVGSVMLAPEAIGPLATFALWLAIFAWWLVRSRRDGRAVYFMEWFAVIGCVVTVQLLLDLRMRWLGDVVIAVLHGMYAIAVGVNALRARRARARSRRVQAKRR